MYMFQGVEMKDKTAHRIYTPNYIVYFTTLYYATRKPLADMKNIMKSNF